jgi:opacity protein-like surface antigen
MKTNSLSIILLFSSMISLAQIKEGSYYISKGQWMAGGEFSLSNFEDRSNHTFTVSPMGGYFITKKIAVGLQTSYSHTPVLYYLGGSRPGADNSFSVSPFVRYYISTKRIALFAEGVGGANWLTTYRNFSRTEVTTKSSTSFYTVGMGLNYFISRDVALEGILRYADGDRYDKGFLDFDIGLQFFLSRGNKSIANDEGNYFSKGQWIIGGTGNVSLGALDNVDLYQFSVAPMAGYLVDEKIAVGLFTAYTHIKGNTDSFFAGPFLRYYLTQKKLAPYAEVMYGGSWTRNEYIINNETTVDTYTSSSYRIGAGVNYFISKNVALDGNFRYSRNNDLEFGSMEFNAGLQFFIR